MSAAQKAQQKKFSRCVDRWRNHEGWSHPSDKTGKAYRAFMKKCLREKSSGKTNGLGGFFSRMFKPKR